MAATEGVSRPCCGHLAWSLEVGDVQLATQLNQLPSAIRSATRCVKQGLDSLSTHLGYAASSYGDPATGRHYILVYVGYLVGKRSRSPHDNHVSLPALSLDVCLVVIALSGINEPVFHLTVS